MSRIQHSRKAKKQRHFRSLSDPNTLSELALRLKEGIYITTLNGETRTVVDSAFLSVDPDSGEKYCHGILVEITHRKELQTQLLELSIREPLTAATTGAI